MQWILVCILIFKRRRLFECLPLTLSVPGAWGCYGGPFSHPPSPPSPLSISERICPSHWGTADPAPAQVSALVPFARQPASCHTRVMPTAALTGKWRLPLSFVSLIQLDCSLYLLSVCVREEGAPSESQPHLTKCWQLSLPETLANMQYNWEGQSGN